MKFYATTERGLEDIAAADLKAHFNINPVTNKLKGKIFFDGTIELIPLLNFAARSINRVVILLGYERNISTLRQIKEVTNEIDWSQFISRNQTFAVKSVRVGVHDFTSLDISRVVGETIINNIKRTGLHVKVNLSDPDVKVIAELINDNFIIGIDTSGLSLHIRRYRIYNHPMSLRTTLAYLLIRLSNWSKEETLLDPTCGGGTIPIEAALFARNIPPVKFRKNAYAFYKLRIIDHETIVNIKNRVMKLIDTNLQLNIYGLDINPHHIEGSKINAKNAGVDDTIVFVRGNAEYLSSYFKPNSINKIVTNPPYKLPNRSKLIRFYHKFTSSVLDTLTVGGRGIIISSEIKLLNKILQEMNISFFVRKFRYGRLPTAIFIINKD